MKQVSTATGHIRAIKNPFGSPIAIIASWGEPQYGDENCMIADICDGEGNSMAGEPYIIDALLMQMPLLKPIDRYSSPRSTISSITLFAVV